MKKVIAIIIALLALVSVHAQNGIGFSYFSQNSDSLYYGDTLKLKGFLKFYGAQGQTFTEIVKFKYKINNIVQQDSLSDVQHPYFQIAANTGVQVNLNIPVSVSKFMTGGGHTIIVWPVHNDTLNNLDSVKAEIFVLGYLGTDEAESSKFILAPNPFRDFISVIFPPEMEIQQAKLGDIMGKAVPLKFLFTKGRVEAECGSLTPGIYILQLKTLNGKQYSFRVLKE